MADKKVLFEVDASKILAKLHLAAKEQAALAQNEFLVNTGIMNDSNAKPENPGNVTFVLNNHSHKYQVGIITSITYDVDFNSPRDLVKQLEYLASLLAEQEKNNIKDEKKKKNPQIEKLVDEIKNAINNSTNAAIKALGPKIDAVSTKKDDKKAMSFATSNGVFNIVSAVKEIIGDIENDAKSTDLLKNDYESAKNAAMDKILEQLTKYFTTFAGKDNVKKIGESNIMIFDVSEKVKDANDKNLVKTFEIQPATEPEIAAMKAKFKAAAKDGIAKNCKSKVCFCVNYTLDVEK